jgi:hypothetical protein
MVLTAGAECIIAVAIPHMIVAVGRRSMMMKHDALHVVQQGLQLPQGRWCAKLSKSGLQNTESAKATNTLQRRCKGLMPDTQMAVIPPQEH